MFGCHPSLNHCPPRRSGRSRTYACIAISKGINTLARDQEWTEIGQQVGTLLLKSVLPQGIAAERRARECYRTSPAGTAAATGLPQTLCVQEAIPPQGSRQGSPCQKTIIHQPSHFGYPFLEIWGGKNDSPQAGFNPPLSNILTFLTFY